MENGEASYVNEVRLFMNREEYVEETFYSFSYSPIYNEAGEIAGLFCPSTDVSSRVLSSRRLEMLSALTANALTTKTVKAACLSTIETLSKSSADIPFALLYFLNKNNQTLELLSATGIAAGVEGLSPLVLSLDGLENVASANCFWPLKNVLNNLEAMTLSVRDVVGLPLGLANQSIRECMLLPLKSISEAEAIGVVIMGVNPARTLDKEYKTFYELVGGQITRTLQNIQSYEEEKKRAEQLAELDRAKTVFFSNVSHEFRTPLTLMVGPLEESLEELEDKTEKDLFLKTQFERLKLVRRNGLRLLKLVNSLLDFSRIEAKRIEAVYEPSDLAGLTKELASAFQSAMEKAHIKYTLDIQDIGELVYIDKEMWEKIIFNLLSNAFKFTFEGEIRVSLKKAEDCVLLSIQDTGVGIAQKELPHVFERFHRIESTKGRSYEGTGIGLALIQELVGLHRGTIRVFSEEGKGTTFVVSIPLGYAHLPQNFLNKKRESYRPAVIGSAFVEEAERWLPTESSKPPTKHPSASHLPSLALQTQEAEIENKSIRILLADDNADMRQYVSGILKKYWEVEVVSNGEEALNVIEKNAKPFDLILSDVMMPKIDGFALVHELRSRPSTQHIPVILLSARAGEEAEVVGLKSGANDYLVKPFSAKELVARVHNQVKLASHRNELEEKVGERTRELHDAMRLLYAEMQEKINKEKELVEHKTKFDLSVEFQERLKEFINTVCHEIRNPLHVIFGNIDFLQDSLEEVEDLCEGLLKKGATETDVLNQILSLIKKCKEYLHIIENSCEQEKVIVDDALDYSKVASNKIEFHPVSFHLQQSIENFLKKYEQPIQQKKLNLKCVMPPEVIWLKADSFRFFQVISNLISNAIKFTPAEGTITLTVENEIISETECSIKVMVEDTGIGMSPEGVSRLFQSFSQAHAAISSEYGGSGLGLLISKNLVEKMGGTMQVQSQQGKGSIFSFNIIGERLNQKELESIDGQQASSLENMKPSQKQEPSLRGVGKTVLIVDDIEANRKVVYNYLKSESYSCEMAENGAVAVEKCRNSQFDFILMDIEMPVMNGIVATLTLRGQGLTTPIIGLSGYGTVEQVNAAMQQGFTDYLAKPIRKEELFRILEKYTSVSPETKTTSTEEKAEPRLSTYGNFSLFKPAESAKSPQNLRKGESDPGFYIQRMVNQSIHYMTIIDTNYIVLTMNEAAKQEFFKIFGKECKEGMNMLELTQDAPEKQSKLKLLWEPALQGKRTTMYEKFTDQEGKEQLYEVNIAPIKDEEDRIVGASHVALKVLGEKEERRPLKSSMEKKF